MVTINNDVIFPNKLAYGSRKISGGWGTKVVTTGAGKVYSQQQRSTGFRRFDISYGVKSYEDMLAIEQIFEAVGAQAEGFLFNDVLDFSSAANRLTAISATDQSIGTADGTDRDFQLVKSWSVGSALYSRPIYRPKTGTVIVALDGTPTGSNWTVDYDTGILSVTAAFGSGTVTAGYEYYVPVMFEVGELIQALNFYKHGNLEPIILRELIALA